MKRLHGMSGLPGCMMCVMLATSVLLQGCNSKAKEEAERKRLRAQDSVRKAVAADSLRCVSFRNELHQRLEILGQPSIEHASEESYRLIAEFSWGKSPVGPMISILIQNQGPTHSMTIHSYPNGKRVEVRLELSDSDFRSLKSNFDSVHFDEQPVYLESQLTRMDANKYFVEHFAEGQYHGIVRQDSVDQFVFDLFVAASTLAQVDAGLIDEFRRLSNEAEKAN